MSIVGPGLNGLIENLNQLALHKSLLTADVRESMRDLQLELEYMKSVAGGYYSMLYSGSEHLKFLSKKIRGVINEAEDAVDAYVVSAAIQKSRGWVSRSFLRSGIRDFGKKIAQVTKQVKQINEIGMRATIGTKQYLQAEPRDNRLGASSEVVRVEEEHVVVFETPAAFVKELLVRGPENLEVVRVEEEHVVGFETPAAVVKELLVRGPENLEVIAIAGMSGLGKTTLASMVYRDPHVDYEYMIRAFVYVSRQYDKRTVLLQILNSFSYMRNEIKEMREEELEKYVCEQLKGRQYLIVLDDVWETEDWDAFKGAFPNNQKRCRVLITTTNARVAERANRNNPDSLYMLEFLTLEHSRELLRWKVFGLEKCPDYEIEQYVRQIASKCNGLPMAIVIIAGILINHPNRVDWWREVSKRVHNLLSSDRSEYSLIGTMYEYLPDKLKPCFLYLGMFPGDYEIPVWKLVRLWVSEGFIDGEENPDLELEDVAEQHLEELVKRNLVMVGRKRSNGKMKTCCLHDTLREFCKREAQKENLSHEVNTDMVLRSSLGDSYINNYRRLYINDNSILDQYMSGPVSSKGVRSFLTFLKEDISVGAKDIVSFIPKNFKLLKVLEAPSLYFTRIPVDLVLLKYLTISSTFHKIPSSLSGLWNLQTLIISTFLSTLEVDMDLWKMPSFRHFHTNSTASLLFPDKTRKMEQHLPRLDIQTLSYISTECCSRRLFDQTPKLKKLGISGRLAKLLDVSNGESGFVEVLGMLKELENLKLINDDKNCGIYGLPSHTCFPPQLTKLTLMNTLLDWKEMSTLGRLERLEVLKLKEFAFKGPDWETEEGGFVHLVHLFIGQTDLESWGVASVRTFPSLKTLELNRCDKLNALPAELVGNTNLQLVALHCTNPAVASSARKLQVLRPELAKKTRDKKNHNFRLSIYPPDH